MYAVFYNSKHHLNQAATADNLKIITFSRQNKQVNLSFAALRASFGVHALACNPRRSAAVGQTEVWTLNENEYLTKLLL